MQFLKQYGERLAELGYRVVPIPPGGKGPKRKGWSAFNADAAQIRQWVGNGSVNDGAGILAATTPAIDVDVLDAEVAQIMSDVIDGLFPGVRLMSRTGRAPKFLVPFRCDEPFRKLTSAVYTDGTHDHKVEILGDGQQWVAYHVHPETGKPYTWFDGVSAEGITAVAREDLPVLTLSTAQQVIDAFDAIASTRWQVKHRLAPASPHVAGADPFGSPTTGRSVREVEALLVRLPNADADYDHWFQVLAAVHHELGDEGEALALEWSSQSSKHTDEKFERTWSSLGRYTGRVLTLRTLLRQAHPPAPAVKPGDFVQVARFTSEQRIEWHIKHVIPKRALTVVYGAPGSSKSFFVLDLVAHIARGVDWRGHKVRASKVAYIAAEGVSGFANRLTAYGQHHAIDLATLPLFVRGGQVMLNESALALAEAVNELGGVGVVVIDTLAAVTPGANENTSEDMGLAIQSANLITEATGASVILIHHANKSGEMRGWSGLLAAADNSLRIEHDEATGLRTAHVEKLKEGKSQGQYGYRLQVVHLGADEDGDPITSCVVDPCHETTPNMRGEKVRKPRAGDFETSDNYKFARVYLNIIEEAIGLTEGIQENAAIAAIQADEILNPDHVEDTPSARSIKRTIARLVDKGKVFRQNGLITLV